MNIAVNSVCEACCYVIAGSLRRGTESDQAASETCQTRLRCVWDIVCSCVTGFEADDVWRRVSFCRPFQRDHCQHVVEFS